MNITIPTLSLVLLVGASGSGKSTFARKHFKATEVLSSDACRGMVSDDENNQAATKDAFEVLHFIAAKRLAAGRLTVVDATNVQVEARKPLLALARQHHALAVAIVFDLPEQLCQERNRARPDRDFGPHVVRRQVRDLRQSLRGLRREGFHVVHVLSSQEDVDAAQLERQPLWVDRRHDHGPFDVVGDVHGCFDELRELLATLGYQVTAERAEDGRVARYAVHHPDGRKVVFLGDLVDRGPGIAEVLRLAMDTVESGAALCVMGNHERKLLRKLQGRDVQVTHGLAQSLAQLEQESPEFRERVARFLDGLISHYVLDDGNLVVAHAGLKEELQGRASSRVRDFALFGETTGETDEFGLPVRLNWAAEYRGRAAVVYGHTPVPELEWLNRTINVDTGCVFGGRLTALRYPEKELVSVPAARTYYEPARPFLPEGEAAPAVESRPPDDLLDLDDVLGRRAITTRLLGTVTIREEQASAALEVMSRFAVDPRWLVYLPPTMSPSETSRDPALLEHPAEAFAYYRHEGVPRVVCEAKHMGSRAVVLVCRDEGVPLRRFGVPEQALGLCYTRTGRRFFEDGSVEAELLARLRRALDAVGFWDEFGTDWACLDCELLPWSAKAQELLRQQYAPVGAAARAALPEAVAALERAALRPALAPQPPRGEDGASSSRAHTDAGASSGPAGADPGTSPGPAHTDTGTDVQSLLDRFRQRAAMAERYVDAYRRYCWPVRSVSDLRLAPFHLLATEGGVHVGRDHAWHMDTLARVCAADGEILLATSHKVVDVTDADSQAEGIRWWEELTGRGGEGTVVKPLDFVVRGRRGLAQPAVKCRGREYLRVIYGPEYTLPEHLEHLRQRSLGAKRALALREFALGIEALERFVRREPLYRVHECVFAILALESEPVDPRL